MNDFTVQKQTKQIILNYITMSQTMNQHMETQTENRKTKTKPKKRSNGEHMVFTFVDVVTVPGRVN